MCSDFCRTGNQTTISIKHVKVLRAKKHNILTEHTEIISISAKDGFYDQPPTKIRVFIVHDTRILLYSSIDLLIASEDPFVSNIFYFSSAETTVNKVSNILKFLWNRFQLLNIIAKLPCSSTYGHLMLIYKPFERDLKRRFGVVHLQINNQNLIWNGVEDLNGYSLRVPIFQKYPTSITKLPFTIRDTYRKNPNPSGFYGFDGVHLSELSAAINFTISSDFVENVSSYEPKKFESTFRMVTKRQVDLQANSRYLINFNVPVDYSFPVSSDYVHILVPKKSEVIPKRLEFYRFFKSNSTIVMIVAWTVCCFLNILVYNTALDKAVTEMYCIAIGHPQKNIINTYKVRTSRQIFIGSCLIFFMMLWPLLTGDLTNSFISAHCWPQIKSLEEFDKTGMMIKITSFNYFKDNNNSYSDLMQRLSLKVDDSLVNMSSTEFMMQHKNYAIVKKLSDIGLKVLYRYTNKNGKSFIHVIPEYVNRYFLVYIAPLGSPYLPRINQYIMKFQQSGLSDKWYHDFARGLSADIRMQQKIQFIDDQDFLVIYKRLNLFDVQCLFYGLFVGYILSFVIFLVEFQWKK